MKLRIFLLITILFSISTTKSISQNALSTIKMNCKCTPHTYYPDIYKNKIFYIVELEKGMLDASTLKLIELEKIGSQWIKNKETKIDFKNLYYSDEDSSFYEDEDNLGFQMVNPVDFEKKIVSINNNDYYYSIMAVGNHGSAFGGQNSFIFLFYNMNIQSNPIILYYEKWDNEFSGTYRTTKDKKLSDLTGFIKISNLFINEELGVANDDINHISNYAINWEVLNENIYSKLNHSGTININFIEFSSKELYNNIKKEYSVDELSNSDYSFIVGFASPMVIYDKKNNKSIVGFIPEGWPNGAAWGFRSFYPKNINKDTFTIESGDEVLIISYKDKKIKKISK